MKLKKLTRKSSRLKQDLTLNKPSLISNEPEILLTTWVCSWRCRSQILIGSLRLVKRSRPGRKRLWRRRSKRLSRCHSKWWPSPSSRTRSSPRWSHLPNRHSSKTCKSRLKSKLTKWKTLGTLPASRSNKMLNYKRSRRPKKAKELRRWRTTMRARLVLLSILRILHQWKRSERNAGCNS